MTLPNISPINFKDSLPETNNKTSPGSLFAIKDEKNRVLNKNYLSPATQVPERILWDIDNLENFYNNTILPRSPVQLNPWTKIINPSLFIHSHLEIVRHNNGIIGFKPYYDRLLEFKNLCFNT